VLRVQTEVGDFCGTVTARSVAEILADDEHATTQVGAVTHLPRPLSPAVRLDQVLRDLASADSRALPVLDDGHRRLVGWVSHRGVLAALDSSAASSTSQR
jgi:CIC family chloride channel protein